MNFCPLDMIYEESQKFVSFALRLLWMLHKAFIQHSLCRTRTTIQLSEFVYHTNDLVALCVLVCLCFVMPDELLPHAQCARMETRGLTEELEGRTRPSTRLRVGCGDTVTPSSLQWWARPA